MKEKKEKNDIIHRLEKDLAELKESGVYCVMRGHEFGDIEIASEVYDNDDVREGAHHGDGSRKINDFLKSGTAKRRCSICGKSQTLKWIDDV